MSTAAANPRRCSPAAPIGATPASAQSNDALIIENDDIAAAYYAYWQRLKTDGSAQGQPLRQADTKSASATVDGAQATVWYSPNTKQTTKPAKNAVTPPDMAEIFHAMAQAKYGIFFLVFQPGMPSIIQYAAACETVKPGLLVYGAATDPKVSEEYNTILVHRTTKDVAVVPAPVVSATALNTQFDYWQKELLKLPGAHAIIHDKIVVIDPLSDDCVVIAGSHNLGYRASYNNDENLVIIKGHKPLAQAYVAHVMDIYDHYRWRFTVQQQKKSAFNGLDPTPGWQAKYFLPQSTARREALFWTSQTQPCPDVPDPPVPQGPGPAAAAPAKSGGGGGSSSTGSSSKGKSASSSWPASSSKRKTASSSRSKAKSSGRGATRKKR